MESYEEKLELLKNGSVKALEITKEEFLTFREVLIKREDFKHFSGNAQQGGNVIYTYSELPRS